MANNGPYYVEVEVVNRLTGVVRYCYALPAFVRSMPEHGYIHPQGAVNELNHEVVRILESSTYVGSKVVRGNLAVLVEDPCGVLDYRLTVRDQDHAPSPL